MKNLTNLLLILLFSTHTAFSANDIFAGKFTCSDNGAKNAAVKSNLLINKTDDVYILSWSHNGIETYRGLGVTDNEIPNVLSAYYYTTNKDLEKMDGVIQFKFTANGNLYGIWTYLPQTTTGTEICTPNNP